MELNNHRNFLTSSAIIESVSFYFPLDRSILGNHLFLVRTPFFNGVRTFRSDYTYSGAKQRLVEVLDYLESTPGADNNLDFLPASSVFTRWGGSLEIGSVFLNMTWYQYQDAAVLNHMNYTIGGNIHLVAYSIVCGPDLCFRINECSFGSSTTLLLLRLYFLYLKI